MVRFSVPHREQVLFGDGGLEEETGVVLGVWGGGWETAGQEGERVPRTVLAAFMNVFGVGPVLEISQNYFRGQQI